MIDIPGNFPLSPIQKLQIEGLRSGKSIWKKTEINDFVDSLQYPLYFLDFESFQPAVPLYDKSRPYQQIPFQYSMHLIEKEGSLPDHFEYLAEAGPDPRPLFTKQLIKDAGDLGDVLVYNKAFEKRILQDIIRDFPEFKKDLERIISRMQDLMVPFRKKLVYFPEMKGSYSIKNVLPALVPGYGYSDLEIADGGSASIAFQGLFNQTDPESIETTRQQLLNYCEMDTLAMVKILEAMKFHISQ